jgi:hypothetical protein
MLVASRAVLTRFAQAALDVYRTHPGPPALTATIPSPRGDVADRIERAGARTIGSLGRCR